MDIAVRIESVHTLSPSPLWWEKEGLIGSLMRHLNTFFPFNHFDLYETSSKKMDIRSGILDIDELIRGWDRGIYAFDDRNNSRLKVQLLPDRILITYLFKNENLVRDFNKKISAFRQLILNIYQLDTKQFVLGPNIGFDILNLSIPSSKPEKDFGFIGSNRIVNVFHEKFYIERLSDAPEYKTPIWQSELPEKVKSNSFDD